MFKWIVLNRFYLTEECPLNIFVEIGLKINMDKLDNIKIEKEDEDDGGNFF